MQDKSKTKKKREIKKVRQKTGSYCGPAVMEMLVSALGIELNQESLVDASNVRGTIMKVGAGLGDLTRGLLRLYPELRVWKKDESSIAALISLLAKGYFVGVDWQGVFDRDEYGDDVLEGRWEKYWKKLSGYPDLRGDQGHYIVITEVNIKKGYVRFADPYGHFAEKDRFISLWEFEQRWWDDSIIINEKKKRKYIFENRLMFVITTKTDKVPGDLGMVSS